MRTMSNALLEIETRELKFVFEVKKQATCSVHLFNKSNSNVAFKVKTTSPKKYYAQSKSGIIEPESSCNFTVTMQAQGIAPPDMICKDKFLLQATVVPAGTEDKDIKPFLFSKEDGRYVEENKLRVLLISPPSSPVLSPVTGTSKPVPDYEVSVLEDPVQRKIEIFFLYPKATETVEAEMELSAYAKPEKDLIYSPVKVVEEPTELTEKKEEFNTAEEIEEPAKSVEYNATKEVEEPSKNVAYNQNWDVKEPEYDIEYINQVEGPALEELGKAELLKFIEERMPNVKELDAFLSKDEEARRFYKEMALRGRNKGVATYHVGFSCLFVCMVALVCTFLGYPSSWIHFLS